MRSGTILLALLMPVLVLLPRGATAQTPSQKHGSSPDLAPEPSFEKYLPLTPGIKPPQATYSPDPKFPDLPPGAEDNGKVILLVGINTKGRVEAVRVLRDDWEAFEKSAVDTVRTWRFKPAEKDGKPVPVQITVDIKFRR